MKQTKSTPASTTVITKPPPSAAVSRAPKGTSIDKIKGLDDDELDYDDDVENEDTIGGPSQPQALAFLTIRSPEVDPEVNLEADYLMDFAVLLPKVTEFILVTGLVLMTGAKIETMDQIMAHTTVMTTTDTAPVTTGIMMTDTMTSTEADIMTGVMTEDMMTGVDAHLHVGVLLIPGLMTSAQMT